jgi:hypothetical protein
VECGPYQRHNRADDTTVFWSYGCLESEDTDQVDPWWSLCCPCGHEWESYFPDAPAEWPALAESCPELAEEVRRLRARLAEVADGQLGFEEYLSARAENDRLRERIAEVERENRRLSGLADGMHVIAGDSVMASADLRARLAEAERERDEARAFVRRLAARCLSEGADESSLDHLSVEDLPRLAEHIEEMLDQGARDAAALVETAEALEEARAAMTWREGESLAALWTEHGKDGVVISSQMSALSPGLCLIGCDEGPSTYRLRAIGRWGDLKPLHDRLSDAGGEWDPAWRWLPIPPVGGEE